MLKNLKYEAEKAKLKLNPLIISCDFEKGAIKAFNRHFLSAKIVGCHFHFRMQFIQKFKENSLKYEPKFNFFFKMFLSIETKLCVIF